MGMHSDKSVKHYNTSADYITQSVERSLKEMAIETIDLLLFIGQILFDADYLSNSTHWLTVVK